MILSEQQLARLTRTSRKAAIISAVGAVLVLTSIVGGSIILIHRDDALEAEIAKKKAISHNLDAEILAKKAAEERARVASEKANQANQQAEAAQGVVQDLDDRIRAASDANACPSLLTATGISEPSATDPSARTRAREEWRAGQAALLKQKSDQATAHFHAAIAADPGYAAPYNSLGRLEAEHGNAEQAAQLYKQALTHSPTYTPALYNLTLLTERTSGRRDALIPAKQLLQLRPDDAAAQHLVKRLEGASSAPQPAPIP